MNRIILAALLVAGVIACDHHPIAPSSGARGGHIEYGHVVTGSLSAPDSALFYLDATAGDLMAVYATSPDSTVTVGFSDSGSAYLNVVPTNRGALQGSKALFTYLVPHSGAFTISVVRPATTSAAYLNTPVPFDLEITNVYIGPEHVKPAIAQGQVISGESIDSIGDIDVFTFTGTAGKEVVGYIQALGEQPDGVTMSIYATNPDSVLQTAMSPGGDAAAGLEYYTTNPLTLPVTGTYHVKLQGDGSYVGPYQFEIYPIDSAPESISANVTPGDTVQGESIDHVGDIDVFNVKAKAGATYNLFAQSLGAPGNALQFTASNASGTTLAQISASVGPALTDGLGSGDFAAPSSGQFTVTVQGSGGILNRGPYRFFVYPVSSAPEIAPATFAIGDSVTTETIGLPGDTDIFTMHVTSPSLASVCVTGSATAISPALTVKGPTGAVVGLNGGNPAGSPAGRCTPSFSVTAGSYAVIVADPQFNAFRGKYTINSYAFTAAPEHVSPVITIGDTVTGESIDVPGDIDTFTLRTHAYQELGLTVIPGSPNLAPFWTLNGPYLPSPQVYGGAVSASRLDLDSAGTYTFTMQSFTTDAVGPYRFVFSPWPLAPEHHAATVALGTSITDEPIDYPGDIDQFTLTGAPGAYGIVSLLSGSALGLEAMIMSSDSTLITYAPSAGYLQYSQRFQMPASGSLLLRVRQFPGEYLGTGPYQVNTIIVNPLPEHVPAAVAIGDTVSGESIDYIGDLDQFTFSGTAGQQIVVDFQTPQGVGANAVLQVLGPDGSVLGQVMSINPAPLSSQSTGTITLPTTGQYTIAVSGAFNGQSPAMGPYVFAIIPAP